MMMMNFLNGKKKLNNKEDKSKYWFTRDKMDKILKVHDYLDLCLKLEKFLSFGSILRVAEDLNKKNYKV